MTTITASMSQFQVDRAAVRAKAQTLANERGQAFLVFVCPKTGQVDAIADADRFQVREATVLERVYPRMLRSLGDALASRGEAVAR